MDKKDQATIIPEKPALSALVSPTPLPNKHAPPPPKPAQQPFFDKPLRRPWKRGRR